MFIYNSQFPVGYTFFAVSNGHKYTNIPRHAQVYYIIEEISCQQTRKKCIIFCYLHKLIAIKQKLCAKYYKKTTKFKKFSMRCKVTFLLYTKICQSKHNTVRFFGKNIEFIIPLKRCIQVFHSFIFLLLFFQRCNLILNRILKIEIQNSDHCV